MWRLYSLSSVPLLKDEEHHFNHLIPCRNPVTVHFDGLGGFQAPTDEELKVADMLSAFLFMGSGIMAGEDVVEVDGTSGQETDPLRLGELRESRGVEERRFRRCYAKGTTKIAKRA